MLPQDRGHAAEDVLDLDAVDHQHPHPLLAGRGQAGMRGLGLATHADDTGVTEGVDDGGGACRPGSFRIASRAGRVLLGVARERFELDHLHGAAGRISPFDDTDDTARRRRMQGHGRRAIGCGQQLPPGDLVALAQHRRGRTAGMLAQRQVEKRRERQLPDRRVAGPRRTRRQHDAARERWPESEHVAPQLYFSPRAIQRCISGLLRSRGSPGWMIRSLQRSAAFTRSL